MVARLNLVLLPPLLLFFQLPLQTCSFNLDHLWDLAKGSPHQDLPIDPADLTYLLRSPSKAERDSFVIDGPLEEWEAPQWYGQGGAGGAYVAVCTAARDDNPYIREWVAFNRCIGVGKVYIFDDRSHLPMLPELNDYIEQGYVEYEYIDVGQPTQIFAYNECMRKARGRHKWLINMDTDEAIVLKPPAGTQNIGKFLSEYEEYSGIVLQWVLFGNSDFVERPDGGTMRNYYKCTRTNSTAPQQAGKYYIKTAAQPERVEEWKTAHTASYYVGHAIEVDSHDPVIGVRIENHTSIEHVQLNHYAIRSFEDFVLKNMKGGGDGARRQPAWYFRTNEQASGDSCYEAMEIANQCFGKLKQANEDQTR